jgi:carbonic anhydrase/SulP family sulfate permease
MLGFRNAYLVKDETQFVDYSTRDLQNEISPIQVLQLLREGHERFRTNRRLTRDFGLQAKATAVGQHPLAVILNCIDSRTPAELIFDLGVGDVFSVRLAGNIISNKALGSIEYACAVAGAKLIMVLGHTRCGAVTAAVNLHCGAVMPEVVAKCEHIRYIVEDLGESVDPAACPEFTALDETQKSNLIDAVAHKNVVRVVEKILNESRTLRSLVESGQIGIVGAMYDVTTSNIEYLVNRGADTPM